MKLYMRFLRQYVPGNTASRPKYSNFEFSCFFFIMLEHNHGSDYGFST